MSTTMIPTELSLQIQGTVLDYFAGERKEMLLILGCSLLLSALAFWLWMAVRDHFAVAFAITVIATSVLLSGTALSLFVRDKGLSDAIVQAMGTAQQTTSIAAERERIAVVISKYPVYRYAAGIIACIALFGLVFFARDWVHGVSAGLLLLVVAQVLIDHYSEQRASAYFKQLENTITQATSAR